MNSTEKREKGQLVWKGSGDYIADPGLVYAVNVALSLGKPLLLKGEPGTGKTMLAQAVAKSLQKKLLVWSVKSNARAREGLYCYDGAQRLYDSQMGRLNPCGARRYVRLGKLGQAFCLAEQAVLLIDEIDKADLTFPDDLLWELDHRAFFIPETGEMVRARKQPIVIITSNGERELSPSFLRRCLFYYLPFPEPEEMRRIVQLHLKGVDAALLNQGLAAFYWLRSLTTLKKKPSTSELIDWLRALTLTQVSPEQVSEQLPYLGVLLKQKEDLERVFQYHDSRKKYHVS
ncbi:MAG: MoxR family ATPase [Clostridiales bacterium]|jgi:MoxR-like ATPase|nr:MAG: MoxR family ATPase [Clostridiales bacterium]